MGQSRNSDHKQPSSLEMEQSGMRKDEAARTVQEQALSRQKLLLIAMGMSLLFASGLIVLPSSNEYSTESEEIVEVKLDDEPEKLLVNQPPPDEVLLMNYNDFSHTFRLFGAMSELEFLSDLMDTAQHNLATLSGRQTYYKRQSPFKLRLSDKYKQYRWADFPLDLLGASETEDEDEGTISQPAAELKKTNMLGRWFQGLTKKEADFEIPNFPLDQQPDPEHITHIDADLRACLGYIRNQENCGACYAFSWLSLAEWHYCKQTNTDELADFSEQHIVDCGWKAQLQGCVEGKLSQAKDFSQAYGIHWEKDYAYKSKQSGCATEQGTLKVKVRDFKRIKVKRDQFEQVLGQQPILLEVHLPEDINSYSSGIHPGHNCDSQLGHGMLLVGHGRQEGRPYWLLRNSLGKRWGENGYLRISRDMPDMSKCFKSAFVAKFMFESLKDNYEQFYSSITFSPELDVPKKPSKDLSPFLASN